MTKRFDPQAIVRAISYKPGWSLTVEDARASRGGGWLLRIHTALIDDATGAGKARLSITKTAMIPSDFADILGDDAMYRAFHDWVWNLCLEMEYHEASEWFLVSGIHYKKPH